MNSTLIAVVSVACIFGGTLLGLTIRRLVPEDHLNSDSKDAVKVGAGMVSMMSALVLGLLVSSAKQHFDSVNAAIVESGARVIVLDRILANYGPEAQPIREQLRGAMEAGIALLWPEEGMSPGVASFEKRVALEKLSVKVRALQPGTEVQRRLQDEALDVCKEMILTRWVQIEQSQIPLPAPFIVILLFWLTMLYLSFGLLAPRNWTVITAMFIAALSIATSLFLILEMSRPLDGSIKVSSAPMKKALEHIGRQAP